MGIVPISPWRCRPFCAGLSSTECVGRQPPGWQPTFDAVALSLLQRLGQKGEVHRASFIREVSDERDARSVLTMLAQVRLVENTISALP